MCVVKASAAILPRRGLLVATLAVSLCTVARAQEWIPGEAWKRADVGSRVQWTWGLAEGQALLLEELQPAQRPRLKNTIPVQEAKVISEIMTDLYADSANAYIPWKYMAVVAKMRLVGESGSAVAERLRLLRQFANEQRKSSTR